MSWFTKKKKKDEGFTLIELIIVVAIIGFLMAIAIPRYTTSRLVAAQSATKANLHQLATAIEVYRQEKGELGYPGDASAVATALKTDYLPKSPVPPVGKGAHYQYVSDGSTYFAIYDPVTPADLTDTTKRFYIQSGGIINNDASSVPSSAEDLDW